MTGDGTFQRRLGVSDAVVIGAGSMIGAGVFAAWAPAAGAAGTGLLAGLAIASIVAFCNATSSAQLAAVHPESGGTYVYGRRQLGAVWGHLAGWGFVVGKLASCAAMALTVGAYLWPERERAVAIAAVAAITLINLGGLTRTVAVTRILLAVSLATLAAVVVAGWSSPAADLGRLTPIDGGPFDILRSAGFLFFAFAGYARIATLGEEVRDPETTIPKAIPRALLVVLAVYTVVGVTALATVDSALLAGTDAPLRLVADAGSIDVGRLVRIGAGIAALERAVEPDPGRVADRPGDGPPARAPGVAGAHRAPALAPGPCRALRRRCRDHASSPSSSSATRSPSPASRCSRTTPSPTPPPSPSRVNNDAGRP